MHLQLPQVFLQTSETYFVQ